MSDNRLNRLVMMYIYGDLDIINIDSVMDEVIKI